MLSGLRVHVAGRVSLFTFREWMGELRWGAVQALRVTNFVGLARSRMLFVLLLQLLCLFSVSIAFQSVGRLFGDSENDPFRLCVVLVAGFCTSASW